MIEELGLTGQEEGVMLISGRVLLRLEQGVKVPEGTFYEVVGRHLSETTESRGFIQCASRLFVSCLKTTRVQPLTPSPGRSA